jgi:hypothetical protein
MALGFSFKREAIWMVVFQLVIPLMGLVVLLGLRLLLR